jgi:hypothetical protein
MSYGQKPSVSDFSKDVANGVGKELGSIASGVADGLLELATLGLHKSEATRDYEARQERKHRCHCDD